MDTFITKDGREFIIRKPVEDDAEAIIHYSKQLFSSTDQVLTTPEEYTIGVEDEKTWITNALQNPGSILLIAVMDEQVIGLLFFAAQTKKKIAHTGEFGVGVHPAYQSLGIGRALIENLIKWAKENDRIEKVFLQVFATNEKAIGLYKDLGFIEEGRHVKAIRQSTGEYTDILQLYIATD